MFCPKCGNECPDGTEFCGKCGHRIGDRASGTQAPVSGGLAKGNLPLIPIIAVVAVVLIGIVGIAVATAAPAPRAVPAAEQLPDSDAAQGNSSSGAEEAPNRISPKENFEITDLRLGHDDVNRYVVKGTINNKSDQAYNVSVYFFATRHSSDTYGEETTEEDGIYFDTITSFTQASGNCLTFYDLEPGETLFTIYPIWDSTEEFLDNIRYEVSEVTLPDANAGTRFDHTQGIEITDMRLTQDGRVEANFVNKTGLYLRRTDLRVVAYKGEDMPAVRDNNGARPTGAVTASTYAEILKPNDEGKFVLDIGEGYSDVKVMDITITPDPEKGSFN